MLRYGQGAEEALPFAAWFSTAAGVAALHVATDVVPNPRPVEVSGAGEGLEGASGARVACSCRIVVPSNNLGSELRMVGDLEAVPYPEFPAIFFLCLGEKRKRSVVEDAGPQRGPGARQLVRPRKAEVRLV